MRNFGKYYHKYIYFIFLVLIFTSIVHANTEPVWVPNNINVDSLRTALSTYINMSDSELRNLLDESGKANTNNTEMVHNVYGLGLLYQGTKDIEYARKVTVLLDRYADVFPEWPLDYGTARGFSMWGMLDWFHFDLGYKARHLAQAFDMTRYSNVYDSFDSGTETKIYDFLKYVVKVDMGYLLYMYNMAGTRPLGQIIFGRVLEDPELVHLGYWYYNKMIHECYGPDGYWYGANYDYMSIVVPHMMKPEYKYYLDGYSDPPDFQHVPYDNIWDTARIDNFDFDKAYQPMYERMTTLLYDTALPDKLWPIMNETQSFPTGANRKVSKNQLDNSLLMYGVGHAALTNGSGPSQTQVRLDFSHSVIHVHKDALHLIYYNKGEEVLGGTSYSYMDREWNASTLNQNLVVVNGSEQKYKYWTNYTSTPYIPDEGRQDGYPRNVAIPYTETNIHNNVLLFEPGYQGNKDIQIVEVDAKNAYDHLGVNQYQRMLALVNIANNDVYLVDFFRLRGGSQYDWALHGGHVSTIAPVHPPYQASTNLSMSSTSGSFGRINFQQRATTNNSWYGEFNYNGVINRFSMLARDNTTIYKGRGIQSVENATSDQDYIVVRRQASTSDNEKFLAVHETYTGSPHIQSIEAIQFEGDPGTAVGMKINLDDNTVDYVIHTLDEGPNYPAHKIQGVTNFTVKGRFAHVRVKNNNVIWMQLTQGESLTYGSRSISSQKGDFSYRGYVNRVNRRENGDSDNSFIVDTNLPGTGELTGKTMIVTWGNGWKWGYKIKSAGGNRIVTDDEPGFNYNGGSVDMKYFPPGSYPGPVSFLIPGTAIMDANGLITSTEGTEQLQDEFSPMVITTNPADQSKYINVDSPISITFNETMNTGSVESAVSLSPSANVSFGWNGNTLVITPLSSLQGSQAYTVTISGSATDLAGNPLDGNADGTGGDAYVLHFTTAMPSENIYLYIEAESGTITSPMQVAMDSEASGGQYIHAPNGIGDNQGYADISFTVPFDDIYYIWGRTIASGLTENSFFYSINNVNERIWDVSYEGYTSVWTWDQITDRGIGTWEQPEIDPVEFILSPGTYTLRIRTREDGTKLDQILITNDLNFIPGQKRVQTIDYTLPIGYCTIAVPLLNEAITKASELAAEIESQLGENTVNGLSYWDASLQRWISFAPHLPPFLQGTDFAIPCGLPVLMNTTVSGTWTLSGEKQELCYTLQQGYNVIALDLDKYSITNASELAAAIEAKLGENTVNGLSYWDTQNQRWVSFAPHLPPFLQGTNFTTQPGYSYLVNVISGGEF
ncbi:Ig-like domain-containing protein [candidate division KSB1 bacterium]|nr:Ig-like domain-containing protein [candidate division KSB1 bacterium]